MSNTGLSWLFAAIGIIALTLNIAVMIYLLTKWSRYPRPTRYALGGIGLILIAQIGPQLLLMVMSRILAIESLMIYNAGASFAASLLHFLGLCLLIAAVYVDRRENNAAPPNNDPIRVNSVRDTDSNPYAV